MPTILDILRDKRIPYREHGSHRHSTSGWVQVDCPWCGKDSGGYHLGINAEGGYANCWRCGSKRMGDVLVELLHVPLGQALYLLACVSKVPDTPSKPRGAPGRLRLPSGLGPLSEPHIRYLRERRFDPDHIAQLWGVQAIGVGGRLSWRIWIPVHWRGEVISWTTRSIGSGREKERKYITAGANERTLDAKQVLYGFDYVRHAVIVCEGPFDVWRIGPGAVALMGLGWSEAQLDLISNVPTRVICFDNEPSAQLRADNLSNALQRFEGRTVKAELEASDPAEASEGEVVKLRHSFLD